MWTRAALGLCSLMAACSSKADDTSQSREVSTASDAGADAGPQRSTPAPVLIELPSVVHRSTQQAEDGSVRWGDVEPLDEVETCVVERRDAYAVYQPYEALEEPICVTTAAGEVVRLPEVPANSDLTLTVSKEGYLPLTVSRRVETWDLPMSSDLGYAVTLLLEPEQAALFGASEEEVTGETDSGLVMFEMAMIVFGADTLQGAGIAAIPASFSWRLASDASLSVAAADSDGTEFEFTEPVEADVTGKHLFLKASAGRYRSHIEHPRVACEPMGTPWSLTIYGMGTGEPGDLEHRVLPGQVTVAGYICLCVPPSEEARLLDASSCEWEEL